MPSTFTPDATSGLTPSSVPGPDTVPLLTQPLDGEVANVASIAQETRALANEIAWLKSPRAALGALSQRVASWKNARLLQRFGLDHRGYPAGQFQSFNEDWTTSFTDTSSSTGTNLIFGSRWLYTNSASGGGEIAANGPNLVATLVPVTLFPFLSLHVVTTSTVSRAVFNPRNLFAVTDDIDATMSFIGLVAGAGGDLAVNDIGLGFIDSSVLTNVQLSANGGQGAWFGKRTSDTNWQAFTRLGVSGSLSAVDTGIAADATPRRMRIDLQGANASDDGARRAIFQIDGSVVANVVTNWTGALAGFRTAFSSVRTGAGAGGAWNVIVGPVAFRSNLVAGDVLT